VSVFAYLLPEDVASATLEQRTAALKQIILIFSGIVFGVSLLVWVAVPESKEMLSSVAVQKLTKEVLRKVMLMLLVWLQALIVVCAYVGMKSAADFSLYARDAFGYDDVMAARLGTVSFWGRPFAAIGVGLLGDRYGSSNMILYSFGVVLTGQSCYCPRRSWFRGLLGHYFHCRWY
jgi:nitrate/nitrite transporter NarK